MSRKRWIWMGALVVAAIVMIFVGFKIRDGVTYVNIATGYSAQQACSCLHVSGRSLASCMSDFPADKTKGISLDTAGDRVRVSVAGGLFRAESVYDERYGCRLSD